MVQFSAHAELKKTGPIDELTDFHHQLIYATVDIGNAPYQFGGNDQEKGLDCSSYIQNIYKTVGIELARSTRDQVRDARFFKVPLESRSSGDLIFFKNTYRKGVSHVGIFIDHDYFAHASSGDHQVVIEQFSKSRYFKKRFYQLKRLKSDVQNKVSSRYLASNTDSAQDNSEDDSED